MTHARITIRVEFVEDNHTGETQNLVWETSKNYTKDRQNITIGGNPNLYRDFIGVSVERAAQEISDSVHVDPRLKGI